MAVNGRLGYGAHGVPASISASATQEIDVARISPLCGTMQDLTKEWCCVLEFKLVKGCQSIKSSAT